MIQEPLVITNFSGNIANGNTQASANIPIVGHTSVYGLVYSNAAVTVYVDQGIDDQTGAAVYRYTRSFAVGAGLTEARTYPVFGKYVRIRIENLSGGVAAVESFFAARPYA